MQEGVASEACSLAGHLGLGRLIVLYDDNKITIVSLIAGQWHEVFDTEGVLIFARVCVCVCSLRRILFSLSFFFPSLGR